MQREKRTKHHNKKKQNNRNRPNKYASRKAKMHSRNTIVLIMLIPQHYPYYWETQRPISPYMTLTQKATAKSLRLARGRIPAQLFAFCLVTASFFRAFTREKAKGTNQKATQCTKHAIYNAQLENPKRQKIKNSKNTTPCMRHQSLSFSLLAYIFSRAALLVCIPFVCCRHFPVNTFTTCFKVTTGAAGRTLS